MSEPVSESVPTAKRRSRANLHLLLMSGIVAVMFGFAYANAEFFALLCQKVGILSRGPDDVRGTIPEAEKGREIEVYFSSTVNNDMPISFSVDRRVQKLHLGERAEVNYRFTNLSRETIYFRPTHDVSPTSAGREGIMILEKCFCFDEQKIGPGQSYTLPVVYTFTDKLREDTGTIMMRYFLWRSDKESYEKFNAQAAEGRNIGEELRLKAQGERQ